MQPSRFHPQLCTMGFSDTFDFDEADYVLKLKSLSAQELRKREVRAHHQQVSSTVSIGSGVGFAIFTGGGVSLIGSAYGARRLYLAEKKLSLIQEELTQRKIELYKPKKRDILIPLGVGIATIGAVGGIDVIAAHATCGLAAHAVAHHGAQAVNDVVQQPESFMGGVEAGISAQVHEVTDLVTAGMQHATSVAAADSYFLVAGSPFLAAGQLVGIAAGESLALLAETKLACFVLNKVSFCLVNAFSGTRSQAITYFNPSDDCRRIEKPSDLLCEHCKSLIHTDKEVYYVRSHTPFPKYFFY